MRGGPSYPYPISSDHHSFAAKIITNLKNARSQLRVKLTSICNSRSGGTVSTLQMWTLRLGEVWKSQSQQVQGCWGGLWSPCFSIPHPPVPSSEREVRPACPLHLPSQAYGTWVLGPRRGIEGRMADPEAAGGASATWSPGPQGDLVGAGHRPGLSRFHLQTKVRVWCLQAQSQERGCFSIRSR